MQPETLKILLLIALHRGWEIRQWDVVAAYLQAELHHDVYISDVNEDGQSGHKWYKTLQKILEIAGLKQCIRDERAYTSTNGKTIIGTHVDDLIGIAPQGKDLDEVEASCEKSVELEKRGIPRKILGMEAAWNQERSEVILTQKSLIETISTTPSPSRNSRPWEKWQKTISATRPGIFQPSKPRKAGRPRKTEIPSNRWGTPVPESNNQTRYPHPSQSPRSTKQQPFTSQSDNSTSHIEIFVANKSEGIILHKPRELNLVVSADVSYGRETSRSQSEVLLTLGNQPVGWYSRCQDVVTLSITEAEYIADCEGAKDIAWTQQLLQELKVKIETPILKTDSERAYNLSQTAKFLRHSRHIQHHYHYLRQQAQNKALMIVTIPGKENPADHLTKLTPMSAIRAWKELWIASSGKTGSEI